MRLLGRPTPRAVGCWVLRCVTIFQVPEHEIFVEANNSFRHSTLASFSQIVAARQRLLCQDRRYIATVETGGRETQLVSRLNLSCPHDPFICGLQLDAPPGEGWFRGNLPRLRLKARGAALPDSWVWIDPYV